MSESNGSTMKRIKAAVLGVAILVGGANDSFGAESNVDELVKQLAGEVQSPARSGEELEQAYKAALDKVTPDKPESDDAPLQRIVFRASRPGAENERATLARVMAARLKDAKPQVQVVLLRHIQWFGREESVRAVAELLSSSEPRVRESARRALEANPTRAAGDALREQLERATDPQWKSALLTALEYRRDQGDSTVFAKIAGGEDEEVVRIPAM